MSVTLGKPALAELQSLFLAECCCCANQIAATANSAEEAIEYLDQSGWKCVTTDDEINDMTCPTCVAEIQAIDKQEQGEA